MSLYYQDDFVTLYHGDCLELRGYWLDADVLITDPPYGSDSGMGYGRRGGNGRDAGKAFCIANDSTSEVRDAALEAWGSRPALAFGTPRLPEPPGGWDNRLVWDKREPGLNGGPWRYTHESIFVRGDGWKRTSASSFSILSYPSGNGSPEKKDHVHAKPIALMMRLIDAAPDGGYCGSILGKWVDLGCSEKPWSEGDRRRARGTLLRDHRQALLPGSPGHLWWRVMTAPKPRPAPPAPTHVFRAVWPIIEGSGSAETDAELISQAIGELPTVAHRHHAQIVGAPRACIADGRRVPGSGGAPQVVVIEAPAVPANNRAYRHNPGG